MINKKPILIFSAVLLLPLLILAKKSSSSVKASQEAIKSNKNVLMILCDDMGAMELGCYGNNINNTPNLNGLAESGVKFETFYATPVCSPTRVGLMTGKYAYKTGWANMKNRDAGGAGSEADLARDEYTFGQMFQDAGYRTAMAGKWQLTGKLPEMINECGFDEYLSWIYFGYLPDGVSYKGGYNPIGNKPKPSRFWHPGLAKNGQHIATTAEDYGPDMFSDFIIDFMENSVQAGEPFFAYYPMVLMHTPWLGTPDHKDVAPNSDMAKKANVEYTDKIVGKLITAIERLNIRENTLVIFVGDNGTQGIGKSTVTEWGPRTPAIISCPGTVKDHFVSDELLELSDLLPTMLDFASITPKNEAELDGISVLQHLKGEKQKHRKFIWSNYGQFRIIREKNWLLEHNSIDGFGDLYYCGTSRNGLNYQLITDFSDPAAQNAKKRFESYISQLPVVDISKEAREDFDDFVRRKKQTLLKNLEKIYEVDYGHSSNLKEKDPGVKREK